MFEILILSPAPCSMLAYHKRKRLWEEHVSSFESFPIQSLPDSNTVAVCLFSGHTRALVFSSSKMDKFTLVKKKLAVTKWALPIRIRSTRYTLQGGL